VEWLKFHFNARVGFEVFVDVEWHHHPLAYFLWLRLNLILSCGAHVHRTTR
jgi:hypothetical protein